ncbi:hypothetical protein [Fructilactobacillus carniphilus]|uniref:Uncharacterized protein n=1 Tax=Fructilactobacillus carniphilus TaxID=2940297 RepID=A0ABY5BYN5_9LACO|nr:hypothetical protein [Fructilactobacillus carniphilus]USS90483.1 hypothetical protein M3M37_06495 [Fructilactobacillus carniphilus]
MKNHVDNKSKNGKSIIPTDQWNKVLDKIQLKKNRTTKDQKAILVDEKNDDPNFIDWVLHG